MYIRGNQILPAYSIPAPVRREVIQVTTIDEYTSIKGATMITIQCDKLYVLVTCGIFDALMT